MAASPEAERLRIALDMADTGIALMRQNLRRVLGDVEGAGVGCAIVGGLAVSARTELFGAPC
jgi:hypothetical protein